MWAMFVVAFAGIAAAIASKSNRRALPGGTVANYSNNVKAWEPAVQAIASLAGVPWRFAMEWLRAESGGNPCAFGLATQFGPDGKLPREIGLFQLYNPNDFQKLGVDPAAMRAYCVPGTQRLSRKLTPEEVQYQIEAGIGLIKLCQAEADKTMAAVGVDWHHGADYWAMVKLYHALPVILRPGLANVAKRLGRPPINWMEFRKTYEDIVPAAKFNPKLKKQNREWRALNNAQETGAYGDDGGGIA